MEEVYKLFEHAQGEVLPWKIRSKSSTDVKRRMVYLALVIQPLKQHDLETFFQVSGCTISSTISDAIVKMKRLKVQIVLHVELVKTNPATEENTYVIKLEIPILLCMKRFSGLTFIRYAREQKVGKPNKFNYDVSTEIERVQNSTAKIQPRSTLPEGVGTLGFINFEIYEQ